MAVIRVELRDRSFNLLDILDREIMGLSWAYSRIGGCGEFSFELPRRFCNEKHISGDFNVRIYKRTGPETYALWYQGLVEDKVPSIKGDKETIAVRGHGYQAQLSRIYVDQDYTSQEVSVIVKSILDNYITPNTNITYSASDIEATGFTPDSLKFNTDALRALQTCADIVGSREWGVDKDRKFFFKARSSTVGFRYPLGAKITDFDEDQSFKDIINRVIIQGGEIAGSPYTKTYNDTASQLKYNIRTKVIQNSSITTDNVSQQYANSIFAEFNDVVRRVSFTLVGNEDRIETTIPIPLLVLLGGGVTYGKQRYGTFLYSGLIERQINKILYSTDNNGNLKTKIDAGYLRPNIAEELAQLDYQLEQARTATL